MPVISMRRSRSAPMTRDFAGFCCGFSRMTQVSFSATIAQTPREENAMGAPVVDFTELAKQAVPDPNKLLAEVLRGSERWSLGQKIAGAVVSLAAAGLVLGI